MLSPHGWPCVKCMFLFFAPLLMRPRDNRSTGIVCVRGAGQAMAAWKVRGHSVAWFGTNKFRKVSQVVPIRDSAKGRGPEKQAVE